MLGKNIIISIDDFGIGQKANKNFLELLKMGKIDRVAVMANGQISESEARALLASDAKLDIHLDFQGEIKQERKLKEGFLKRGFLFFTKYIFNFSQENARVEKVWEKQIKDFQKIFGKIPDGLNSHQHLHFFPAYFKIALKLARKYQIKFIRFGKEPSRKMDGVALLLDIMRRIDIIGFKKTSLATADLLISFDWIKNFKKFQESLPEGKTAEVIFHPERDEEFIFLQEIISQE